MKALGAIVLTNASHQIHAAEVAEHEEVLVENAGLEEISFHLIVLK